MFELFYLYAYRAYACPYKIGFRNGKICGKWDIYIHLFLEILKNVKYRYIRKTVPLKITL